MGKILGKILDGMSVTFLALTLVLVFIQVVMRYIFNAPLIWSEELARYCLVWLAFTGSMIAMRERQHIEITFLSDALPEQLSFYMQWLAKFISAGFLILLAYTGFQYVSESFKHVSPVTHIPMGLIYVIIPISAIGMLIYMFINKKEE